MRTLIRHLDQNGNAGFQFKYDDDRVSEIHWVKDGPDLIAQILGTPYFDDLSSFAKNELLESGMAADDVISTAREWVDYSLDEMRIEAIELAYGMPATRPVDPIDIILAE